MAARIPEKRDPGGIEDYDDGVPVDASRAGLTQRLHDFFAKGVWEPDLSQVSAWRAWLYRVARVLFLAGHGFVKDNCMFRASALSLITILSLVPLLAFAFSAAKGFGAFDRLRDDIIYPFVEETFSPAEREVEEASDEGEAGAQAEVQPAESSEPSLGPSSESEAIEAGRGGTGPGTGAENDAALAGAEAQGDIREAIYKVLGFVENTDFSALGTIGLIFLIYTVIKLLSTIERSFNEIWGVKRSRSLVRKVSDYLSMVIITPILLLTGTLITAAVQNNSVVSFMKEKLGLGSFIEFLVRCTPLFVMWLGFSFLYVALPNTRTKWSSAAFGGVIAGTLWFGLQIVLVKFQIGTANYNQIYSGFAALPIFLVWLYASWAIVLVGAEFAHAHQSAPDYRAVALTRSADHAFREILALRAMAIMARVFLSGKDPMSVSDIAAELGVPTSSLEEVVGRLNEHGLLALTETEEGDGLLPAHDLDLITVKSILDALKGTTGPVDLPGHGDADSRIDEILAGLNRDLEDSSFNRSLRELAGCEADEERASLDAPAPVGKLGLDTI